MCIRDRYRQGVPQPYGIELPPGLKKNDPLPEPVITPTTKATGGAHDERLTSAEVVEKGLVSPGMWREVQQLSLIHILKPPSRGRRDDGAWGPLLIVGAGESHSS